MNNLLTISFLITTLNLMLVSCGGGGGATTTSGGKTGGEVKFTGLEEVTPNKDGTWTLWWKPILGSSDIRYNIYKKSPDAEIDFETPITSTIENTFITEDLRLVGNTCYAVRFTQPGSAGDNNTREVCTNHSPYKFKGITKLTSLRDGTYTLRWDEAPFDGAQFQIYQKKLPSKEWQSLGKTSDAFYKTKKISLDEAYCFRVQYRIEGFPDDSNTKELCTAKDPEKTLFSGIENISSPSQGVIKIEWPISENKNVTGYNVYLGKDFKQKITEVKGRTVSFYNVEGLQHAVTYTFAVRAVDSSGREDTNKKVMSYELKNHKTVISKVTMVGDNTNRPTSINCEIEYSDADSWQILTPTFKIINRKRDSFGDVDRITSTEAPNTKSYNYTLDDNDDYRDELICIATINDGFETTTKSSNDAPEDGFVANSYIVPDTPVIATGLSLTALENTPYDITIALGDDLGYTDEDQDKAININILSILNGEILPTDGYVDDPATPSIDESRVFDCISGTCTATFLPAKDFYTNPEDATPLYASINYTVEAGSKTSTLGTITINVRPTPRALGFEMIAQQDEERVFNIGKENGTGEGKDKVLFAGYTYALNSSPSKIYVRQPLTEGERNGKIYLPDGVTEDIANDIFCADVPIASWTKDGFECAIPCADFKCPLKFLGDSTYYGPSVFEYAVVVDGIQSNYGTVNVTVLPNLRATGYLGLTVEGETFNIEFSEGHGYEGSGSDIEVTSIVVTDPANNLSPISFSSVDSGVTWQAQFVPTAGFNDIGTFNYVVKATNTTTGQLLESNTGLASIRFYEKPIATDIEIEAIETVPRSVEFNPASSPLVKNGYYSKAGDKANKINVSNFNTSRGFLTELGNGVNSGSNACAAGQCLLEYNSELNYYDTDSSSFFKFNYTIETNVSQTAIDIPNMHLDDFLTDVANRTLVSNVGSAFINVRPIPKVIAQDLAVRESTALTPSQLTINLAPTGVSPQYTHALGLLATSARILTPPTAGSIGSFNCDLSGVCTTNYAPAVGQVGYLLPDLSFAVSVTDSQYTPNAGVIESDPGTLAIDVRPVPKPTGLSLAVVENTSFIPSNKTIEIQSGTDIGYTHAGGEPALSSIITESLDGGGLTHGSLTPVSCTIGTCTATYTPDIDYYGLLSFKYSVTTNDAKLGDLQSDDGDLTIDVRPRPRTIDVGSTSSRQRVDENTDTDFTFNLGSEYTHPYNIKAKDITVTDVVHGTTSANCSDGLCTVTFTPETGYEGDAYFKYTVTIEDPVLAEDLVSNESTLFIDVYPAPKATDVYAYVLQNTTSTITLDLRPGRLMNEDAFDIKDHKGYTHRRDDPATSVSVSAPTSGGTIGDFTCDANGKCTADYISGPYVPATVNSFNYTVTVGGIESNTALATINIRPTAVAEELDRVMVQDDTIEVTFLRAPGQGYTHPLDIDASYIEVMSSSKGTASVIDLDTGSTENTCNTGTCKISFTPDADYFSPQANLQEAYFTYRVWSYDAELAQNVPSNIEHVYINVRPKPKALDVSLVSVQGDTTVINYDINTHYTYPISGTPINTIDIVPGSNNNGSLDKNQLTVNNTTNQAGPLVFTPGTMGDGSPYYGAEATFQFKAVIFDSYLNANIESNPGTITIDYRPRPVATGKHFITWQKQNVDLLMAPNDGYTHPYFPSDNDTYKAISGKIISNPSDGTITNAPDAYTCDTATYECHAEYVATADYYYQAANGFLKFNYTISVFDPVLGSEIESLPAEATIEVRPILINTGKSVYGVQTVAKSLRLEAGSGFQYPGVLPSVPTVNISNPTLGSVTPFTCDINGCDSIFTAANTEITGLTSFDYSLTINDPDLGAFTTDVMTYEINFYPIPKATAFTYPLTDFEGIEGQDLTIKLTPADADTSTLCNTLHGSLAPKYAYLHKECEPAVEAIIDSGTESNGFFAGGSTTTCDEAGVCSLVFSPNPVDAGWPGYGQAQFDYKVRIDPTILSGLSLSPAEVSALTSAPATAQVEFYPIPRAGGLYLGDATPSLDYIYGVQNYSSPIEISRCDTPTTVDQCQYGYIHGYNENATAVSGFSYTNLSINPWGCAAGTCTSTLTPTTDYYSNGDFATFEYEVTVHGQQSNRKQVKVNVYPRPIASNMQAYGLENEDMTLTIDLNSGYTHVFNDKAIKIQIIAPPDAAVGQFVDSSDNLMDPAGNLDSAFTCVAGTCTATFRPTPDTGLNTSFFFNVLIAGPDAMPANLKAQLTSEQKEFKINVIPKPVAHDMEIVVIEDETSSINLEQAVAYTHDQPAVSLTFQNGADGGTGKSIINNIENKGSFLRTGLTCIGSLCTYDCQSNGNCAGVFTPNSGVYSNTQLTSGGCSEVGANCPSIDFKVKVHIPAPVNLDADSKNTSTIKFNVRPLPTSSTSSAPTIIAEEGETIEVELRKTLGYDHPFYPADAISNEGTTHGSLQADFVCQTVATVEGVCTAMFVPEPTYYPAASDRFATVTYKTSVVDPTFTDATHTTTVGTLTSSDQGILQIEYRAKPRTVSFDATGLQDNQLPVTLSLNNGYTQEHSLLAKKIIIPANTQTNMLVNGCSLATDCEIACTSGNCDLTITPTSGFYGDATLNYFIVVDDPAFTPTRELTSPTAGLLTVDFRPLPIAEDLSFNIKENNNLALSIQKLAGSGYTHPYNYDAIDLTVVGSINNGSLQEGSFTCTSGTCAATLVPALDFYGDTTLVYNVSVNDPVLGTVTSLNKTITVSVRPTPEATGFNSSWYTKENYNRTLDILEGSQTAKLGYFYPSGDDASYDLHPKQINLLTPPDPTKGSFPAAFACSTGVDAKGCSTEFTPSLDSYGVTSFDYSVAIHDPILNTDLTSNVETINIEVRPIIRAFPTTYTDNTTLKAIQGQDLTWTLSNSSTQGFTYPVDAAYSTVLDSLSITTIDDAAGHGTASGATCTSGSCSGVFTPDSGYFGEAKFNFKLDVTDSLLPATIQNITTAQQVATIDVYPLPVANNTTFYTIEDTPITLALSRGATTGFEHNRNDDPTAINIINGAPTPTLVDTDFSCTGNTCSANYTPNSGFKSATNNLNDAIKINYKVAVTEPGATPRTATSANTGVASVMVYPRSTPDVGAGLTNIVAWEGEPVTVTLDRGTGLGYQHIWNDDAKEISIPTISVGSAATPFTCSGSACSTNFTPKEGVYGNGAADFTFLTKTTYAQLADPNVWSLTPGTVSFNVRAVPKTPTDPTINNNMIEDKPLTDLEVSLDNGYTYGDSANRQISTLEVRQSGNNKITPASSSVACISGTCTFPALTPAPDFERSSGSAEIEYRVKVTDELAGPMDKWSEWSKIQFGILPHADAENLEFADAIEETNYQLVLELGTGKGYEHVENAKANKIEIIEATNLINPADDSAFANTIFTCTTEGVCTIDLKPITTNFSDITGKTANPSDHYGWSQIKYRFSNPIDGKDIWSNVATTNIYVRPAPRANNVTISDAIENEPETISLTLGNGYTHPENKKASTIEISNISSTNGSVSSSSCDSGTGICDIVFESIPYGTYTFETKVTDETGVKQITPSVITVTFVPRPRNQDKVATVTEGNSVIIQIDKNNGYTHVDNHNAKDVTISNLTNGTIKQVISGTASTCSDLGAGEQRCQCDAGNCKIKFTPTAWSDGEDTRSGSFVFKTRDNSYLEADETTPLSALASANVAITMEPRIRANSRNYAAGIEQGVEDSPKTVSITEGVGGTNTGGYTHTLALNADTVRILSITDTTITGCASAPCDLNCVAGVCDVIVNPLTDTAFKTDASFTYNILENGFTSHIPGTSSVYFYPKPKATTRTQVVPWNTATSLEISQNDGYTHLIGDNADSWAQISGSPNGTLGSFSCSSGTCTALYEPSGNFYSTSNSDFQSFTYSVTNASASGNVTSGPTAGVFNIEVFPVPVASSKTLKWVQGIGDRSNVGKEFEIEIKLNQDYTHARGSNPKSIITSNVSGGSFSGGFTCAGDTCTATFIPSAVSADNATAAASFDYQVEIDGYEQFPSNIATVSIIVMPRPAGKSFTAEVLQGKLGETTDFKFALLDNLSATPVEYSSYTHGWNSPLSDITIVQQPLLNSTQTGNIVISGCSAGVCSATYTSLGGSNIGQAAFTYKAKVIDATTGLFAYSPIKTAYIDIQPVFVADGVYASGEQLIVSNAVVPTTDVAFSIANGAGYTTDVNSTIPPANIVMKITQIVKDNTIGTVDFVTNTPVTAPMSISANSLSDTLRGESYWFGHFYAQYQICDTDCDDADRVKSALVEDKTKWLHIYIDPSDVPPEACEKIADNSPIIYKNIAKTFIMEKGTTCDNGIWYLDGNTNPEDFIHSFNIYNRPSGSIVGVTGTTCSTSGTTVSCTCGTGAEDVCAFKYTPPTDTTAEYTFNYEVITHSSLLNMETTSLNTKSVNFKIIPPLAAEAVALTASVNEDVALPISIKFDTTGDTNPTSDGYLTIKQMNTANSTNLLPAPDGYDMKATAIDIVSYDNNYFSNVTFAECNDGVCDISATPKVDAYGTSNISYRVLANGVYSPAKNITATINPTDDAPNTFALGQTSMIFDKLQYFTATWGIHTDGAFYQDSIGYPTSLTIKKWTGNPYHSSAGQGSYADQFYGYHDAEENLATSIRIENVVGGTVDSFSCTSGTCTATFTPDGTIINNYATFNYYVTTDGGPNGPQEQPQPSLFRIYVSSGDTTSLTAKNLPSDTPDVTSDTYNPDYVIARGQQSTLAFRRGAADAYEKGEWNYFDYTDLATGIEIGDGTNGAVAPTNVIVDAAGSTCTGGTCLLSVTGLEEYPDYPAEATFWYRMVSGQNFVTTASQGSHDFGNHLVKKSAWKKVTLKVILNFSGGCDIAPSLASSNTFLSYDLAQGDTLPITVGNTLDNGNYYTHPGTVGTGSWRKLYDLEFSNVTNGDIDVGSGMTCTTGVCTFTFRPTGYDTPNLNDDYIGRNAKFTVRAHDDFGCASNTVTWNINIKPKVVTRDKCIYDTFTAPDCILDEADRVAVAANTSTELVFRKRTSEAITDYNTFEYETSDGSNAVKVKIYDFDTSDQNLLKNTPTSLEANAFTNLGAGGSCSMVASDLVCETNNCDTSGTCRLNINTKNSLDWGNITFKYEVILGDVNSTKSRAIWARHPDLKWPYWGTGSPYWANVWLEQDADYHVFVKATPVVTNPNHYKMGVNETISLKIGKEDNPNNIYGYTYADSENFSGKAITIDVFNPVNGQITSTSFDQNTKISDITFKPDFNFSGTATIDYKVSVWGVESETGSISIDVDQYLTAQDFTVSMTENTAEAITLTRGSEYFYTSPSTFEASAIEIKGEDYNTLDPLIGAISLTSCNGTDSCTFTITPATGVYGTYNLKYRLESGDPGSKIWTPWQTITLDIAQAAQIPIVANMSFTGFDNTSKLIALSMSPDAASVADYGYYDVNGDQATSVSISSEANGVVDSVSCSNGICLLSFTPNPGVYGNASFNFSVNAGGDDSLISTITVDFDPVLTATSVELNGVRAQTKLINISLNNGYTYNPGALADSLTINSVTHGTTSAIDCTTVSGTCTFNFIADDYIGDATFTYSITAGSKTSTTGTGVIHLSGSDTPAIATSRSIILSDHNSILININFNDSIEGYTDAENDKATAITIVSQDGLKTITDNTCLASGDCSFTIDPIDGFEGPANVHYTVTTNGIASNEGILSITVPSDTIPSFHLAWNGTPSLNNSCEISIPGQVIINSGAATCGFTDCSTPTGSLDALITSASVTATETSVDGSINQFTNPGLFYSSWELSNSSSETVKLARYLELVEGTSTTIKQPTISLTPSRENSMEGSQMLAAGCNGESCTSQQIGHITTGEDFSCTMLPDTRIQCWGSNNQGKLGNNSGTSGSELTPVTVKSPYDPSADLYGALAVSAGQNHACALLTSKQVICWGDNTYGQLGNSTNNQASSPEFVYTDSGASTKLANIVALSSGGNHTCAVDSNRNAWCWGANSNGQLGNGSTATSNYAVPVIKITSQTGDTVTATTPLDDVFSINAGSTNTCAIRLDRTGATINTQNILCWGANDQHQIGDNNYKNNTDVTEFSTVAANYTDNRLYPTMVRNSSDAAIIDAVSVSVGYQFACANFTDGSVQCWGHNANSKLGINSNGTTTVKSSNPSLVLGSGAVAISNIVSISAGKNHACATTSDKKLLCWGDNSSTQLGDNSSTERQLATPVMLDGSSELTNAYTVSAGTDHTCALTAQGIIKCWGNNTDGELGTNSTSSSSNAFNPVEDNFSNLINASIRECSKIYTISTP